MIWTETELKHMTYWLASQMHSLFGVLKWRLDTLPWVTGAAGTVLMRSRVQGLSVDVLKRLPSHEDLMQVRMPLQPAACLQFANAAIVPSLVARADVPPADACAMASPR